VNLLVFAHRAEAKSFISTGNFKPVPEVQDLLLGELIDSPCYLLICGEGIHSAISTLSQTLGLLQKHDLTVINYGVCGALREGPEIGNIYEIKTCYAQDEFKSFTHSNEALDLITAKQRVLESNLRNNLDNFAPLVDREAWGLSFSCKQGKVPLRIFKIVSDHAGEQEICTVVKENAPLWSDQMLSHYLKLEATSKELTKKELPFDQGIFHITISQERILTTLIRSLKLKHHDVESIDLSDIIKLKVRPKEKTKLLIERLHAIQNPLDHKLQSDLNELAAPYKHHGVSIRFDNDLEDEHLHLTFTVKDQKHMSEITNALNKFDYQKLKNILDGKTIDV
jgi:nucleoside phosphorylase